MSFFSSKKNISGFKKEEIDKMGGHEIIRHYIEDFVKKYDNGEFNYFDIENFVDNASQFQLSCLFLLAAGNIGEIILGRSYRNDEEHKKYAASVAKSLMSYLEDFTGNEKLVDEIKKQFDKKCQLHK